ncbi:MAG: peptidyl-prolyl cis-trans isomerase [Caulobacterales bacterium]|nr:peptidyl-prolyl cis-trans isomerase [Caulobacterales bacterium]
MLLGARKFTQSWFAKGLLGLIILAMAGFGVSRYGFQAIRPDAVIHVGSRTTTSYDFKREYDNYKKRLEQQSGQTITPELADQNHLDAAVLNGLATRESFAELLSKIGIKPSDKLILAQIEKIPGFFDPVSGRFDKKIFLQRLAENGFTAAQLDAQIRDDMAAQHWAVAVQNGLGVPRAYGALASVFALETRDLAFMTLTPQSVPAPADPTDAQLATFVSENKSALTLPETRQLTVVAFTPNSVAANLGPIDPAELKKRYDFRKDTLSKPETRTLTTIPVKDQAAAQAVAARLGKGELPDAVAKSIGVSAVDYADKPLSAIPDHKVAQAAFKMAAGQVAVVPGDLGLFVVKVAAVTPGHEVSLEEARPMLEAEIKKDMVAKKVYDQTQAFDDAHSGGASIADAAQKVGATAQAVGPISRDGRGPQGQPSQQLPPKVLETAFSLPAGGESEVTELGDGSGSYFLVKVDKVIAPHIPPMEEIKPVITQVWKQRQVVKALEAKAQALTARIQKGETLDAVAASEHLQVTKVAGLSRQTAQSHTDVPQPVLGRAFGSKPGEVWTARAQTGLVIGRVDNVQMDSGPAAARLAENNRGELTATVFREMAESAETYARAKLKAKVDPDRARSAVGFEPLKGKDAKGKPEKKG